MSKQITPCDKLGYKVGDKFEVIEDSAYFKKGDIVSLNIADNSSCPFFINESVVRDGYSLGCAMYLSSVKKISKLKPTKQALADAIHQNGGWRGGSFAAQDRSSAVTFFMGKPWRCGNAWDDDAFECVDGFMAKETIANWHQCILSRDEYFTAYPEQVNVVVNNETEHKVEAEMTSDKEITIKVSDWHKNGELPPVGEVVEVWLDDGCECWHKAYVVGYSIPKGSVIAAGIIDKNDKLIWSNQFRPLRTEREKAIDEMVSLVEPLATYREFAGAIYDAGMYKGVK